MMKFGSKRPPSQQEAELANGLNFVNSQISGMKSMIFQLEQQIKSFEENRDRIIREIDELRKAQKNKK